MDRARFSVFQFLDDGTCNYVRTDANIDDAVAVFATIVNCVGARIGTTRRVVITDGRDSVQWTFGRGISYLKAVMVN